MSDGPHLQEMYAAINSLNTALTAVRAEAEELREQRDFLQRLASEVIVIATLQPGEALAEPIAHAVTDAAIGLRNERDAARAARRAADSECAATMADMAAVRAERDGLRGALEELAAGRFEDVGGSLIHRCVYCGATEYRSGRRGAAGDFRYPPHEAWCPTAIARRALSAGNPRTDENRVGSDLATADATPRAPICETCGAETEEAGEDLDGTMNWACLCCGLAPYDCTCATPPKEPT